MDTIPLLSNYKLYKNNRSFNKKITYFLYNSDSNNQEIYKFVNKLNSSSSSFEYIINTKKYNEIFLLNNIIIDINNKKIILIPNTDNDNKKNYKELKQYIINNFINIPTEEFLNSINKNKNAVIYIKDNLQNVLYECENNNMIKISINDDKISYNRIEKKINWNHIQKENKLYNFIQQILNILIEKISDEKISWLNLVYDDIFSKEIFVNAIKQSNYLFLDTVNKRVIRKKLNLNTDNIKEFNPNKENIIPVLDINALEYKPVSDDTELLANKMVDSLFD
jgi:hypothetical protein